MRNWLGEIDSLLGEVDRNVRGVARAVRSVFNDGPFEVLTYRGFGDARHAYVYGRAQENRGVGKSTETDSIAENLMNSYRRADSHPLAFAELAVMFGGVTQAVKADDEGFFSGRIDLATEAAPEGEWAEYAVDLLSPVRPGLDRPASAQFAIISDIDDTVIQSRVSNFLFAARSVILGNARTRLPFPGVAAFYEALRNGRGGAEKNPVFYVSSSPWNIYDVITEFMDLQNIPRGPVLLRDWDISFGALSSHRHFEHKGAAIRNIMQFYPRLSFILIGDSGQHDPEIYRQIYIRDVSRNAERSMAIGKLAEEVAASSCALLLAEDTYAAAKHAAEQGWINENALPMVKEEKRADEGKTGAKVP
jgi:phosphatidate phosphatase APP1